MRYLIKSVSLYGAVVVDESGNQFPVGGETLEQIRQNLRDREKRSVEQENWIGQTIET